MKRRDRATKRTDTAGTKCPTCGAPVELGRSPWTRCRSDKHDKPILIYATPRGEAVHPRWIPRRLA